MARKLHPAHRRSDAFLQRPAQERIGMRRVVITGMSIICPLGHGLETVLRRLVNGRSGIRTITNFNADLPSRVAGQVRVSAWATRPEPSRADRASRLAQIAATEAIQDSGWHPATPEAQAMAGITIGSGCGALEALSEGTRLACGVDSNFMLRGMIHNIATDLERDLLTLKRILHV
jgi:3-oxoacyl-[acyl-carrier-protein] synthase II